MKSMLSVFGLLLSVACMAVVTPSAEAAETHQTARTQFVEVNGTRYAYRAFGKTTSPPLIFLQHFTGTLDDWDPAVTDGLAAHSQVVLLDGKGVGSSGGRTPDTIEAMALAVPDVVRNGPVAELPLYGGNAAALVHEVSDVMLETMRVDPIDLGMVGDLRDDI